MRTTRVSKTELYEAAAAGASEAQLPMLAKLTTMGWQVTTLLQKRADASRSFSQRIGLAATTGAKGWLEVDGKFTRCA